MPIIDVQDRPEALHRLDDQAANAPPKKRGVLAADRIKEVISSKDIHVAYAA